MTLARDDVFRCPAIGRYLTVAACLRRRGEPLRQTVVIREASDGNDGMRPRITEQRESGLAHPECVGCVTGIRNAAEVAPEAEVAPARREAPPGGLVWSDKVPDVPIGPPPSTSKFTGYRPAVCYAPGSTTDARLSALAAMRKRQEADQGPNTSAQEEAMPKGKLETPRPCCGSKGGRHRRDCKAARESAPAPREMTPCPSKAAQEAAAAVAKLRDEQLQALIDAARVELERRLNEAHERVRMLNHVLGRPEAA